jgi:creatinine amidohydrolase
MCALIRLFILSIVVLLITAIGVYAQTRGQLPVKYEELTSLEFIQAVEKSGGVCVIPLGILEKHGPHLPLGTDLLIVRDVVLRAVHKEYAVVYPQYYFGQIFEAKHQPGVIAYSPELIWNLLQETCDELARNGMKKIILVSGHGGNNSFLPFFCQSQLAKRKEYSVILYSPQPDSVAEKKMQSLQKTTADGHAGELETSCIYLTRPDLAHTDMAKLQSGEDLARLSHLINGYTAIWWYAKFPNHYFGDGSVANKELAEFYIESESEKIASLIRTVKKDTTILQLQQMFFDQSENPLKTKQ